MSKINFSVDLEDFKYYPLTDNNKNFLFLEIWVAHSGLNNKKSNITKEAFEKTLPNFCNIPLLAYYTNGDVDQHNIKEKIGSDGSLEIEYLESPCGNVPQHNNIRFDSKVGKDGVKREYLVLYGIIWKKYKPEIAKLFDNEIIKKISFEIDILKAHKDDEGILIIEEFVPTGITLISDKYLTGMKEADSKAVEIFSIDKNEEEISYFISQFTIALNEAEKEKEGEDIVKDKENFGMTTEEIFTLLELACSDLKFTRHDYEYCKYYISDIKVEDKMVFLFNCEEGKYNKASFTIEEGKATIDFESATKVYVVREYKEVKDEVEGVDMYSEILSEVEDKFVSAIVDLKEKYSIASTDLSDSKAKITTLSESIEDLEKEKNELFVELEEKKSGEFVAKAQELFNDAIIGENVTEDDKEKFIASIKEYASFVEFEKDVNAKVMENIRKNPNYTKQENNAVFNVMATEVETKITKTDSKYVWSKK